MTKSVSNETTVVDGVASVILSKAFVILSKAKDLALNLPEAKAKYLADNSVKNASRFLLRKNQA